MKNAFCRPRFVAGLAVAGLLWLAPPNELVASSFMGANFYFVPQVNWVVESETKSTLETSSAAFASNFATFLNEAYLSGEDANTHFSSFAGERSVAALAWGVSSLLLWEHVGLGFKTQQGSWASSENDVRSEAYSDLVEYGYEVRVAQLEASFLLRLLNLRSQSFLFGLGMGWYQIELTYRRLTNRESQTNEADSALQDAFYPKWQAGVSWLIRLSEHPWGGLVAMLGLNYSESFSSNRFLLYSPRLGFFELEFPIRGWVCHFGVGVRLQ